MILLSLESVPDVELALAPIVNALLVLAVAVVQFTLSAIFRTKPEDRLQDGPRLGDQDLTVSAYGKIKTEAWGTVPRMVGNIVWAAPVVEEINETEQTFGGGNPLSNLFGLLSNDQTVTTREFFYRESFRVNFAEVEFPRSVAAPSGTSLLTGRPASLLRLWMNNELVFDATAEDDGFRMDGLEFAWYAGTEDQQPDALEVVDTDGEQGANSTPAYRGMCGIVLNELLLDTWGRRLPNIHAEINFVGPNSKLPTTIYYSSGGLPNAAVVDWNRRNVYTYKDGGPDRIVCINLVTNQVDADWASGADPLLLGGQVIAIDLRGFLYVGDYDSGTAGFGSTVAKIDPLTQQVVRHTSVQGTSAEDHPFSRLNVTGHLAMLGSIGTMLLVGSHSTGQSRLRAYITDVLAGPRTFGGMTPIWDEQAIQFPATRTSSDIFGGFWRNNPKDFDGRDITVEWWVAIDSVFSTSSSTIFVRYGVTVVLNLLFDAFIEAWNKAAADPLAAGINVFLPPFPDAKPVSFIQDVHQWTMTDFNADYVVERSRPAYNAAGDNLIIIINPRGAGTGDLVKIELPPARIAFGPSTLFPDPDFTELGRLTAATVGFELSDVQSADSFISYKGIGPIAVVANGRDEFALVDPVLMEVIQRPSGGDAIYTSAELGVPGANFNSLVYDVQSHSVVFRNGNTDVRRVFLDRADGANADLADVVEQIMTRGSEHDVPGPALTVAETDVVPLVGEVVRGYLISQNSQGSKALEPLAQFFPEESGFGVVESDFQAKAIPFGSSPVRTLTPDDLGAGAEAAAPEPIEEREAAGREFPRRVLINYMDQELEGEPNVQKDERFIDPLAAVYTYSDLDRKYPIISVPDEAATVASRQLRHAHGQLREIGIPTSARQIELDGLDVISVQRDAGGALQPVIIEGSTAGANFLVELAAVTDDEAAFTLSGILGSSGQGQDAPTIPTLLVTDLGVIDVPPVGGTGVSPGVYIVPLVTSSTWPGAIIQKSQDGTIWTTILVLDDFPIWGRTTVKLPDFTGAGFDDVSVLSVRIPDGINTVPAGSNWGEVVHTLTNPGFETGDFTGWTKVVGASFSDWVVVTTATGASGPNSGIYFASSAVDAVAEAELYQDVGPLNPAVPTADIDAGRAEVKVDWAFENNGGDDDLGGIRVEFYDGDPAAAGILISSATSGPEDDRGITDWDPREAVFPVPATARYYRLFLVGEFASGAVINAYFDDIGIRTRELGGVFSFASDLELANGENRAIVGNEIIAFGSWTYIGSGVYQLTHLLRGLECTEPWIGLHEPGDLFVLADDNLQRAALESADINQFLLFRAITSGGFLASPQPLSFTYVANDLRPCLLFGVAARRNAWHGDVLVYWDQEEAQRGAAYEVELIQPDDGSVAKTYQAGFGSIVMEEAGAAGLELEDFTPIVHIGGATGNGDFETGDLTGWTKLFSNDDVAVVTSFPQDGVPDMGPQEGTYLLSLEPGTIGGKAGVSQEIDLLGDSVTVANIDNGWAALAVEWYQTRWSLVDDPGWVEVVWFGQGTAAPLAGAFELDKTFLYGPGFAAGTVSTGDFGTQTPGKRLMLETGAASVTRGTFANVLTPPSGGALTVDVERNGASISATFTVADGASGASFANAAADVYDENDTIGLDGGTINGAGDISWVVALRDLEVFELDVAVAFTLPSVLADAVATATTPPSGGSVTFDIRRNGTDLGDIAFADGVGTATFVLASDQAFAVGDRLTITAPTDLRSIAGVEFSLPIIATDPGEELLREESAHVAAGQSTTGPPEGWQRRERHFRIPSGARHAELRLIGANINPTGVRVNVAFDNVTATTRNAGLWREAVSGSWDGDDTNGLFKFTEGLLVWRDDLDNGAVNEGQFELVEVDSARIMHTYAEDSVGLVDDILGLENQRWIQYGEQLRILLADLEVAGYTRGDPINIRLYQVHPTAGRGPGIAATI